MTTAGIRRDAGSEPSQHDRSEPQHGRPRADRSLDPPRGEPRIVTRLTTDALDLTQAYADVEDPTCGGVGVFVGVVRDHHEGADVDHLEYEAWAEEAGPALEAVAATVLERFGDVRAIHLSHRLGRMEVGEVSVIVAASAPHRAEAMDAARFGIDHLKDTVPIWKHEFLTDGTERWPGC